MSAASSSRGGTTDTPSSDTGPNATRERVLLHVYELGSGTRLADAIRGLNAFTKTGLGAGAAGPL